MPDAFTSRLLAGTSRLMAGTGYPPPFPPQAPTATTTDPALQLPQLQGYNSLYPPPPSANDEQSSVPGPYQQATQSGQPLLEQGQVPHDGANPEVHPPQQEPTAETPTSSRKEPGARGNNRLRKACDSCSIRKVKCDEAGPPCRACAALDIPCTYDRPSRRRGPPNRHAEAIKRQRLESSQGGSPMAGASAPASPAYPTLNLQATSAPGGLSAESIAPLELINLFIDDYFTYVHPLTPFPHEPSFREAWRVRKDLSDRFFLALLAGMIGCMVSLFPRRPRRHIKAMGKENVFPTSSALVDLCRQVCLEARGAGYLEREGLYVYDAATSYYLVAMSSYTYRWQAADLYLGECFTIIRASGFYKHRPAYPPADFGARAALSSEQNMNFIDEEVGRRIFWTIFVTATSARAFGVQLGELPIRPPTPTQGYPPLPMEVDDKYIHATHFERQPHDVLSKLAGFNANCRIYLLHNPLLAMEASYGIDQIFDWQKQKRILKQCYENAKHALDDTPEQLLVWPAVSRSPSSSSSSATKVENHAPGSAPAPQAPMGFQPALSNSTEETRQMTYEIQKANIHVSVLSSRSYFLEKYWTLCQQFPSAAQQQPPPAEGERGASPSAFAYRALTAAADKPSSPSFEAEIAEVRAERESIARDLLEVLSKLRPIHMEPNSVSFCMKIRQIASTLLQTEGDVSRLPDDGLAARYLRPVLEILMEVEKSGQPSHEEDDEEAELRRWTGLRDCQEQLIARNGLSGVAL